MVNLLKGCQVAAAHKHGLVNHHQVLSAYKEMQAADHMAAAFRTWPVIAAQILLLKGLPLNGSAGLQVIRRLWMLLKVSRSGHAVPGLPTQLKLRLTC